MLFKDLSFLTEGIGRKAQCCSVIFLPSVLAEIQPPKAITESCFPDDQPNV